MPPGVVAPPGRLPSGVRLNPIETFAPTEIPYDQTAPRTTLFITT